MRCRLWMLVLWVAVTLTACAGPDRDKSYLLRHALVTLSQAAQIAEAHGPGRAVKAELGHSDNHVYYDVDIIDAMNKMRRLRVDADTGKIIK